MIDVQGLSKRYGTFTALNDVSFQIKSGEIVGFLGPNGAGKSTTMKILTGYLAPSVGQARVAGHDVVTESLEVRRKIGYLPESAPIYTEMRAIDYLDFVGRVRGMAPSERSRAIDRVAEECGITDRLFQVIGTLSKGYKQRVGLAQALLHQPSILVLDEPTNGFDPNQILSIRNLIRKIGASRTVILSTHILSEVEATCDRVLILNKGELVADASIDQLRNRQIGGTLLKVGFAPGTVRLEAGAIQKLLQAVAGVQRVDLQSAAEAGVDRFEVLAQQDVRGALFQLAVQQGLQLMELSKESSSLEEVFRRLTLDSSKSEEKGGQKQEEEGRA